GGGLPPPFPPPGRPGLWGVPGFPRAGFFPGPPPRAPPFWSPSMPRPTGRGIPFRLPPPRGPRGPARPGARPGGARGAAAGADARVPVHLLAVHDPDQAEPWFLATTLASAEAAEQLYRWRMRLECSNRDWKTGVLLREGDDHHALTNPLHLHRLLLALAAAQ